MGLFESTGIVSAETGSVAITVREVSGKENIGCALKNDAAILPHLMPMVCKHNINNVQNEVCYRPKAEVGML